jgi:hypothetical protein
MYTNEMNFSTEYRDFGEKFLIHFSLANSRSHKDSSVRVTIDSP